MSHENKYAFDRQQTADSRQQTADSRQQTADSRQTEVDNCSFVKCCFRCCDGFYCFTKAGRLC